MFEKSKTIPGFEPWPLASKLSIVPPSYDVIGNSEHTWVYVTIKLISIIQPTSLTTRSRQIETFSLVSSRADRTAYVRKIWFENIIRQYDFQILRKSCSTPTYITVSSSALCKNESGISIIVTLTDNVSNIAIRNFPRQPWP